MFADNLSLPILDESDWDAAVKLSLMSITQITTILNQRQSHVHIVEIRKSWIAKPYAGFAIGER